MEAGMIARTWHGWTRAADAETYLEYLHRTGLPGFRATPGNRGAAVLRRVAGMRAEFVTISLWDSLEAVRRFAGPVPERAVFYPEDDQFLVERDEMVAHYEIVYADAPDDALPSLAALATLPRASADGARA
jgi:heme-degrading monooxygenase HmoA